MYTSCFKNYTGGKGVAICLYPPKNWKGEIYNELAPSEFIFHGIKNGKITREEYIAIYNEQLSKLNVEKVYNDLKENVLLCYEETPYRKGEIDVTFSDKFFCHRRLVARWIEKELGVKVEEYQNGINIQIVKNFKMF